MDFLKLSTYDYDLPKELIAYEPSYPRDSSRLLLYKRESKEILHINFSDMCDYLPKDCTIAFNDTKVYKARIYGKKSTGANIELLLLKPYLELESRKFLTQIRGRVKVGDTICFDSNLIVNVLELLDDGSRVVEAFLSSHKLDFDELLEVLEKIGNVPLPPYIKREVKERDSSSYQSVFAKNIGSVAAPTASLHFTQELISNLEKRYKTFYLTLHIGSGTFNPIKCDDISLHKMHSEYYEIPKSSQEIVDSDSKILAVGTTATRTIEEYIRSKKGSGESSIFLHPNNPPKRVDYLLTNFHLPKSTLFMLVSSFVGVEELKRIYTEAIKMRYRFFSYGDAMLIL